ncbi:MAG: DUF2779 domain-containing protein, partial [Nanoarchaeota archaeon]
MNFITNKLLTKSKYVMGLECPVHLWMSIHEPSKIKEISVDGLRRRDEGIKVGKLAKQLFPNAIDIPEDFKLNILKTKELVFEKKPLFEPGFIYQNCYVRSDILEPVKNEWDLTEVKSSTEVKDVNIHDLSFQKFVLESNNLKIRKCHVIHLNKTYERKGELDIKKLFVKKDVTSEVNKAINDIDLRIEEMFNIMNSSKPLKPGILLKTLIKRDYHHCVDDGCLDLAENNVFRLYRGGKLSVELFENNVPNIKDIPIHVKLNDKQNIQRDSLLNNEPFVNKTKIKEFLNKLEYPLHFLDFETFSTGIPMFDNSKPYMQIPFQFSLHIIEKENSEPIHYYFLYSGTLDPRKEFISELKKNIKNKGSIIVWNASFETSLVLKKLLEIFPENKEWTEELLKRFVDLMVPFRDFDYYHPKQEGKCSLKVVLPALTGKDYEGLGIKSGGEASAEFMRMAYDNISLDEKKKIKENLLKYCELDTLAEVMILDKLRE